MALPAEQLCHHYSLTDIQLATQNFNNGLVVGHGGFGKVYKGHIKTEEDSSTVVAIKRLDSTSEQGETEFRSEIEMLSRLRHSHLVSLLGCCVDDKEMIIVYEFMPRGTLYQHLHKNSSTPLSWTQRLRISIGAARGLDYLHTGAGTKHGIIHSDVKSTNILLDEDLEAKISDFGLAKICPTNQSSTYINTRVKGTFGYLDPEFYMTGKLTRKTDVFAFGVVLFELLSGRHAVFQDEDLSLARWAQNFVKKGKLNEIVAADIRRELSPKSLKVFAQIACRCLHSDPKERPTISEVVVALQLSESLQEKFDSSRQPSGIFGFMWKKQKKSVSVISPKVQGIKRFSYNDLKCATRNFQNPIMRSGRGSVTKGWVDKETYCPSKQDGVGLAISVIEVESSILGHTNLLGKFSHRNLVNLLGYCLHDKTLYLVHEFMEKTSLKDYLHKGAATEILFPRRLQIALGVARGLAFLQSKQLINKKWVLDTDDIWLDKEFNAKLLDFDLAMLTNRLSMRDGLTYDPNSADLPGLWWQQLRLCDVNGLGMLLMDLLTGDPVPGKLKMEFLWKKHLCAEVTKMSNNMIENMVDQRIKLNTPQIKEARKLLILILKCTRNKYTMERALNELEQICCRVTQCNILNTESVVLPMMHTCTIYLAYLHFVIEQTHKS